MKKFLTILLISAMSITGALIVLNSFGKTEFQIDALSAELKIDLKKPGVTEIQIPPLGLIKATTHKSPAGINITLQSIDLDGLKEMVETKPETGKLLNEIHRDVEKYFKFLIYKSLLLGAIGGLLGVLIIQRRRWYEYLYGAVIGLLAVTLMLTMTYKSYNIEGFQNPEYEGMLKTAPWMISLVQEGITKFDLWGKQMQAVADNLYAMFERVDSLEAMGPTGEGDLRVLHVSDVHNNPAALDFIEQVAETFKVDYIIDTGDISDFGTQLEGSFVERLGKLHVPYVFIPGNHETGEIINKLKTIPNVTVVEGQSVSIKGIDILGIPDPSAYSQSIKAADDKEAGERAKEIRKEIIGLEEKPDILAIHNHRIATKLAGTAPIILHGHDHNFKIRVKDNSVLIDAGSTGASGIGGLESNKQMPYSLVMLQFKKTQKDVILTAADTIKVSNLQSGYSIERRMFPNLYQNEPQENGENEIMDAQSMELVNTPTTEAVQQNKKVLTEDNMSQ